MAGLSGVTVKHWLESLMLDQYFSMLEDGGYTTLDKCTTLTEADLDRIGITLPGHKKRILTHLPIGHFSDSEPPSLAARSGEDGSAGIEQAVPPPPPSPCDNGIMEDLYDVPPGLRESDIMEDRATVAVDEAAAIDEDIYMNIQVRPSDAVSEASEKTDTEATCPPPFMTKVVTASPNEPPPRAKKPVPAPRGSVAKKRDTDSPSGSPVPGRMSLGDNSPVQNRPQPAPRPRGRKSQALSGPGSEIADKSVSGSCHDLDTSQDSSQKNANLHNNNNSSAVDQHKIVDISGVTCTETATESGENEPTSSTVGVPASQTNSTVVSGSVKDSGTVGNSGLADVSLTGADLDALEQMCKSDNTDKGETLGNLTDSFLMSPPLHTEIKIPPSVTPNSSTTVLSPTPVTTSEKRSSLDSQKDFHSSLPNLGSSPSPSKSKSASVSNLFPHSTQPNQTKGYKSWSKASKSPRKTYSVLYNEAIFELDGAIESEPEPESDKKDSIPQSLDSLGSKGNNSSVMEGATVSDPMLYGEEEDQNFNNEAIYQAVKRQKSVVKDDNRGSEMAYPGVWMMSSGSPSKTPEVLPTMGPLSPMYCSAEEVKLQKGMENESDPRHSTLEFNEPPPNFSPPPLPSSKKMFSTPKSTVPPVPSFHPKAEHEEIPPTVPPRNDDSPPVPSRGPNHTKKKLPAIPDFATPNLKKSSSTNRDTFSQLASDRSHSKKVGIRVLPLPPLPKEAHSTLGATAAEDSNENTCNSKKNNDSISSKRLSEENIYSPDPFPSSPTSFSSGFSPGFSPSSNSSQHGARSFSPSTPVFEENSYEPVFMNSSQVSPSICESDDTLSDGGDFLDEVEKVNYGTLSKRGHHAVRVSAATAVAATVDICPPVAARPTERKGYLYKHTSSGGKSPLGWQKKWVCVDSHQLAYFSNEKSSIPSRIIPVCTMLKVEPTVKDSESHPYQFRLITIDRIYTFASETSDDLTWWSNMLMKAILECKDDCLEDGGEMHNPNKEGFVYVEGISRSKKKRYVAIKDDKMCIYNTVKDFEAFSPLLLLEMKLASVKDLGQKRLQIYTPYKSYTFLYEMQDEAQQWKDAMEEAIAAGLGDDSFLQEVCQNQFNRWCADCGALDPHWASVNLGITVCKQCAGVHRLLSLPLSKVRSLRMDLRVWTPSLVQLMQDIGNDNANAFWEWRADSSDKIDSDADMSIRQEYIFAKYRSKRYCRLHPLHDRQEDLNMALCKYVQFDEVLETMNLLFTGADILCTCIVPPFEGLTPLEIARACQKQNQIEFLKQNGAEGSNQMPVATHVSTEIAAVQQYPRLTGYLQKTGSNHKTDFLKRYCVLADGSFSYYEKKESATAKDFIDRKDMLSVCRCKDPRLEFTFELGTIKQNGRYYLFAAETEKDRRQWMTAFAKTISGVPVTLQNHIQELEHGSRMFAKDGTTCTWGPCWVHFSQKTLHFYTEEKNTFEEIDLRKVIRINMLQSRSDDRCVDAHEDGPPFVLDLPGKRALYLQGDTKKETILWFGALQKAIMDGGSAITLQQLTQDDIPVVVDTCIQFITAYGMSTEGLYRLNGQNSKVTDLLELFSRDARGVALRTEDHSIPDVSTALKRFFRNLDDPLLTNDLYSKWINVANIDIASAKEQWYKKQLQELPPVNYCTLRVVIAHLASVAELEGQNKMSIINIASIFGPALMKVDAEPTGGGFANTNQEITVLKDLIDNYRTLFDIKNEEIERDRHISQKMNDLRKMIHSVDLDAVLEGPASTSDFILNIHLLNQEGECVNMKVSPTMTAEDIVGEVIERKRLTPGTTWGLFEVICKGELERPIHFSECVLDVCMKWQTWPQDFCKDNYLCVKPNVLFENIDDSFEQHSLFCELKFCEKGKNFNKRCFEFSRYTINVQKDTRAQNPIHSWKVEDITIYTGSQRDRRPPTPYNFTFCSNKVGTHFFGHTVCCNSLEELNRWIATLIHAQHPTGLLPGRPARQVPATAQNYSDSDVSTASPSDSPRLTRTKSSFLRKIIGLR